MADTKISALTDGVTANATDRIPVARSGTNVYVTPEDIATYVATVNVQPWAISGSTISYSAGNVGIGTTNPSATLHVLQTLTGTPQFQVDGLFGSQFLMQHVSSATAPANFAMQIGAGSYGQRILDVRDSGGTTQFTVDSSGNVGIGTTAPTAALDSAGDTYRQRTARTPSSATAAGNAGDICWDANYVYVCVATNTWKRSALATW